MSPNDLCDAPPHNMLIHQLIQGGLVPLRAPCWYLNDAETLPSHSIAFGTALVADSTRVLGPAQTTSSP